MQITQKTDNELMQVAATTLMGLDTEFVYPGKIVKESEEGVILEFLNPKALHPEYVIDPPGVCFFVNRSTLEVELIPQY